MDQIEQEHILSQVEHKVGMVKTFYRDEVGASDLISSYNEYQNEGVSYTEIKLFLEDLNLFLESVNKN